MDYREKHAAMRREAIATLIAAVIVMAFWWGAGFGLARVNFTVFYMPGWFVVGCFGSWLLAILAVVFLITRVFRDFSLEDEDEQGRTGAGSAREEKPPQGNANE